MIELGFEHLRSDVRTFLYWKKGISIVVMIVYIDDTLFCSLNKFLVDEVKFIFMKKWEYWDLGVPKEFLWIKICWNGQKILLNQICCLEKIIDCCQLSFLKNTIHVCIMLDTYLDITYAVMMLSCHSANLSEEHSDKAQHILWYLIGMQSYTLVYDRSSRLGIIACTDLDWASNLAMKWSQTRYFFKLANSIFSWRSHV